MRDEMKAVKNRVSMLEAIKIEDRLDKKESKSEADIEYKKFMRDLDSFKVQIMTMTSEQDSKMDVAASMLTTEVHSTQKEQWTVI